MTQAQARELFKTWRAEEYGWLKERILELAAREGEFHADKVADVELGGSRNVIGSAVSALVNGRFLESTGEHRKGTSAASHGRRSYVYRLTDRGQRLYTARALMRPSGAEPSTRLF